MKYTLIICIFWLLPFISRAQAGLDSIMIIPANPVTSDFIRVVKPVVTNYGQFVFGSSWIGSSQVIINSCYGIGMAAARLMHYDTIDVGYVPAGTYELNYNTAFSSLFESCTYDWSTYHSTTLTVTDHLGVEELEFGNVSIYPNPNQGEINIQGLEKADIKMIELLDLSGRHILYFDAHLNLNFDLQNGSYLLRIKTQSGQNLLRRILKN